MLKFGDEAVTSFDGGGAFLVGCTEVPVWQLREIVGLEEGAVIPEAVILRQSISNL